MGVKQSISRTLAKWLLRSENVDGLTFTNAWNMWTAGRKSASGATVTVEKMLACSAWYCVIDLISSDIASLSMFLYERMEPMGKRRAKENPVYKLIHDEPNAHHVAFEFYKWMAAVKLIYGRYFAEIERNNRGVPIALWPIHPSRVEVRNTSGGLEYVVSSDLGRPVTIQARDMVHVKGHSNDGLNGVGLIDMASDAIGLTITAEEYGAFFFRNKAQPSLLISVPDGTLGDEEKATRLRNEWMTSHANEKSGGVGFVEDSTKVTPLGMTNKDAQYLEIRDHQLTEACRFAHVPPHMVMQMEQSTLNNIEHQSIQYVQMALMPHIKPIEQEFTRKLVGGADNLFCAFEVKSLLRGDMKSRAEALHIMRMDGVINADQWADYEDMNQLPDGLGTIYINPVNMEPAQITKAKAEAGLPPTENVTPTPAPAVDADTEDSNSARAERSRSAFGSLLAAAVGRLARIESDKATRAMKKPDEYRKWCDMFHVEHRERVRAELSPVFSAYRETVGNPPTPEEVDSLVDLHITELNRHLKSADPATILRADHTEALIAAMFREK